MKSIRFPVAALALAGAVALAGCEATPTEAPSALDGLHADHSAHAMNAHPDAPAALGAPDLAMIRAASAPYRNEARAVAAGFVDVSGCVSAPPIPGFPFTGAMGHHYVNFERFADISVDPSRPEILLYIPNDQGRMELVGVEFAVNAEAWHTVHGPDVYPEVAGVRFDPPNPMAAPGSLPNTAYTLHVWNWKENPQGMFAPFNSDLTCPAAD
ncbi:MAG: hypothetical protein EA421_01120 [Gemmatimonadales bacterium]|nr:MAG: hypothetical protein EA421_01120 [Gemmatimonadales bacterium]